MSSVFKRTFALAMTVCPSMFTYPGDPAPRPILALPAPGVSVFERRSGRLLGFQAHAAVRAQAPFPEHGASAGGTGDVQGAVIALVASRLREQRPRYGGYHDDGCERHDPAHGRRGDQPWRSPDHVDSQEKTQQHDASADAGKDS